MSNANHGEDSGLSGATGTEELGRSDGVSPRGTRQNLHERSRRRDAQSIERVRRCGSTARTKAFG